MSDWPIDKLDSYDAHDEYILGLNQPVDDDVGDWYPLKERQVMPKTTFKTDVEVEGGYVFRLKTHLNKEHVRTTVYAGRKGRTFALAGVLSLRHGEFDAFCKLIGANNEHEWESDI